MRYRFFDMASTENRLLFDPIGSGLFVGDPPVLSSGSACVAGALTPRRRNGMRRIITVSREFGSGGREVGKRLADVLGMKYIDSEIAERMAQETHLDEGYLQEKLDSGILSYPITFAHSFANMVQMGDTARLIARQHKIIRDIAEKNDCVIVGRGADAILADLRPFSIFVYADMPSKIARCKQRMSEGEQVTDKEIQKQIKRIDKARKTTHNLYASYEWGDKAGYDLCVNTTGVEIKRIVAPIAEMAKVYFGDK